MPARGLQGVRNRSAWVCWVFEGEEVKDPIQLIVKEWKELDLLLERVNSVSQYPKDIRHAAQALHSMLVREFVAEEWPSE